MSRSTKMEQQQKPSRLLCKTSTDWRHEQDRSDLSKQVAFSKSWFPSLNLNQEVKTTLPLSTEEASRGQVVFKRSALLCPSFNRAAEKLLQVSSCFDCTNEQILSDNPNYTRPNPVRLPRFQFFPPSNVNRSSIGFCCDEYSQTPLQILARSVIVQIHQLVSGFAWPSMQYFEEIHNTFHEAIDAAVMRLKQTQLEDFFNIIGLTLPDGCVSDQAIINSLDAKRMTYSNANGEFKLSVQYIRETLKLPDPPVHSQFSTSQPITQYFVDFVSMNTAVNAKQSLKMQLIAGRDDIFQILTTVEENKAFLPIIFCVGMIFGCPFAGSIAPTVWVMRKEVLYMIAAIFDILEIDIAEMIFGALLEDMRNVAERKPVFCLPIWRAIFASKRSFKDKECVSHIPRTSTTFVDIFRYAKIIERTMGIETQNDEEVNQHYDRIVNTYYGKGRKHMTIREISAILMFEKNHGIAGHFKPRLLWVQHRVGSKEVSKTAV